MKVPLLDLKPNQAVCPVCHKTFTRKPAKLRAAIRFSTCSIACCRAMQGKLQSRKYDEAGVSKEAFEQLYHNGLSSREIARRFGISEGGLHYRTRKWGVSLRTRNEAVLLSSQNGRRKILRGSASPMWRGGIRGTNGGYVEEYAPWHRLANGKKYVKQHILVWEKANGKDLPDGWLVHHLNGIKNDNRPENLQGLPRRKHHAFLVLQEVQERLRLLEARLLILETEHAQCSSH